MSGFTHFTHYQYLVHLCLDFLTSQTSVMLYTSIVCLGVLASYPSLTLHTYVKAFLQCTCHLPCIAVSRPFSYCSHHSPCTPKSLLPHIVPITYLANLYLSFCTWHTSWNLHTYACHLFCTPLTKLPQIAPIIYLVTPVPRLFSCCTYHLPFTPVPRLLHYAKILYIVRLFLGFC